MKIVVTGALGHIGSRLIRELPDFSPRSQIVLFDNFSTQRYCSLFNLPKHGSYQFIEGDILTFPFGPIFLDADVVIHLAAITDATNSFQIKDEVEKVNFEGTQRVARACAQAHIPLIFISTTSVYGTQKEIVDETCSENELKPQSPYAEAKLKSEKFILDLTKQGVLRALIFRFGTIFGPSIGMRFHTAINKFCWQAIMGQPITVWRTALKQNRPYLDLTDAIAAIRFVIQGQLYNGNIYNAVTVNENVQTIVDIIKTHVSNLKIEYVDEKIMNQLSYHVKNDRFRNLGFEFKGNLEQGIRETIGLLR